MRSGRVILGEISRREPATRTFFCFSKTLYRIKEITHLFKKPTSAKHFRYNTSIKEEYVIFETVTFQVTPKKCKLGSCLGENRWTKKLINHDFRHNDIKESDFTLALTISCRFQISVCRVSMLAKLSSDILCDLTCRWKAPLLCTVVHLCDSSYASKNCKYDLEIYSFATFFSTLKHFTFLR